MKFRPLHDRVVVKRIEAEEKSAGGIITPTPQRRSRSKVRSSQLAPAGAMKPAS
jgi:co-chaperonin GroES (HSP10)